MNIEPVFIFLIGRLRQIELVVLPFVVSSISGDVTPKIIDWLDESTAECPKKVADCWRCNKHGPRMWPTTRFSNAPSVIGQRRRSSVLPIPQKPRVIE
jgi:hypothetical protein